MYSLQILRVHCIGFPCFNFALVAKGNVSAHIVTHFKIPNISFLLLLGF